jgi:hypothetical protein
MCAVIQEILVIEHIVVSLFCSILLNFEIPRVNTFLAAYFDFHGMSVFNLTRCTLLHGRNRAPYSE